jgi:hypothetical protein
LERGYHGVPVDAGQVGVAGLVAGGWWLVAMKPVKSLRCSQARWLMSSSAAASRQYSP